MIDKMSDSVAKSILIRHSLPFLRCPSGRRGPDFGERLYLRSHPIRSGPQTITVTVPAKPSDAGIGPYLVLIDLARFDNVEEVEIEG